MPKIQDISKVLVVGSGPIVIGQALEFDYAGVQCCNALRDIGCEIVLLNSNPATIMTDGAFAHATYIEPITLDVLQKIYEKEQPDAIIGSMGGQSGLNLAMEAIKSMPHINVLGLNQDILYKSENRDGFKKCMNDIGLRSASSCIVHKEFDIDEILQNVKLPIVIRPSFTLGGLGGSVVYNVDDLKEAIENGLMHSPVQSVLVEESLLGYKEFEFEIIRDNRGNCIMVSCVENIDPVGIHTGDSVAVTPVITLRDRELQIFRDKAFQCVEAVGAIGSCNVQFAIKSDHSDYAIIEMNPRVSRSSALVSKATGYPIAYVSTLIYMGLNLDEIQTASGIPASAEAIADSVTVKIPRFSFDKFPDAETGLTSVMKSVGEVMATASSFDEALLKAVDALESSVSGLKSLSSEREDIIKNLKSLDYRRLLHVADAFRIGMTIDEVHHLSMIDKWFLNRILHFVELEQSLIQSKSIANIEALKIAGFSNKVITNLAGITENEIEIAIKENSNLHFVYKPIDGTSGLHNLKAYSWYGTWVHGGEHEAKPLNTKKVIIIGSGPNRIGQGIEFDYCCVNAALSLSNMDIDPIIINSNPSTVSTDTYISRRLYIEPITEESVLRIIKHEMQAGELLGVIIQLGGQTPIMLSDKIQELGAKIIGTTHGINMVEDRISFHSMINKLGLKYPNSWEIQNINDVKNIKDIAYPAIIRPSYVLGGAFMEIIASYNDLLQYCTKHSDMLSKSTIIVDQFLDSAVELDIDAVCCNGQVYEMIISEHIEEAGIHSGDSSCIIPPYSCSKAMQDEIRIITSMLAKEMSASGFINIQVAIVDKSIYILEVNPRASRSFPVAAKAINKNLIDLGIRLMMGQKVEYQPISDYKYYAVKAPVFTSMAKLGCYDDRIGPSMKSTGEAMGIASSVSMAFFKAQNGALCNFMLNSGKDKYVFISVHNDHKPIIVSMAKKLHSLGYKICCTYNTGIAMHNADIDAVILDRKFDLKNPNNIFNFIKNNMVSIILMTYDYGSDACAVRRFARIFNVPLCTSFNVVKMVMQAIGDNANLQISDSIIRMQDI